MTRARSFKALSMSFRFVSLAQRRKNSSSEIGLNISQPEWSVGLCPPVIFHKFIVPTGCDETALALHELNAVYFVICRRRRFIVEETLLRKKEGRNGREMKPESALKSRA